MRKLVLLVSVITVSSLSACNKDNNELNNLSQIRIVNKTALRLSNAIIENDLFGSIAPFQTSEYHNFVNIHYIPRINFYNNDALVDLGIGYCGTPLLPENFYLKGKFTYTILQDSTNSSGFNFTITEN